MGPSILIRAAVEADVPALVRLLRRTWLVVWAPELPFEAVQVFAAADPAKQHVREQWRSFFVAESEGVLVGTMQTDGDTIEGLDVDLAFCAKGIGSKLLQTAEQDIATTHPVARLEVRSFNTRAISFYERRGWRAVRRYPGFECDAPIENIEMHKQLGAIP